MRLCSMSLPVWVEWIEVVTVNLAINEPPVSTRLGRVD